MEYKKAVDEINLASLIVFVYVLHITITLDLLGDKIHFEQFYFERI